MLKASTEYKLYQAAQSVAKIFEETNKRAEEISARASAQRFRIEIDAKIKESIQKIDDKNTEMKTSFDERAFGEGYTVKNGYYRKKIVKDVSVFSVDTENVKVRMWKDFDANDPEVNLSLLEENVDAVSFSVIMTLVSAQLTDWENSIFGVSGLSATGDDKASTKTVSYIVGEFEKYAYGEQYKGQVELGKGLVGKILLDFESNSQKEKAGWEALDAPTWERKLWCSDTFPGPSIREFSTMVASIVATVCTFGAGAMLAVAVSAAIMATNELTFELADVGVGYHDWEEAAKNVAKAAVSGAITGASGAAMGAASKVGGIGGVFLKTGITSSSSITTQFTNAFIDDGFSGVVDAFNSWSDWQGIAFSTAGSFVTNGVGYGLANTNFAGFNSLQMSQINSIAGTVGGLTTNALEYAFTGQTSFNLLNLSMFGLEYGSMWGGSATNTLSGGFLSMTIGQNGTHFAISSAGTDISLGTLYSNAMGIGHIVENSKIENYTQSNGQENLATSLRIQYGYGDSESKTLLDEILSGKTSLAVSSEKKDGATAQTTTDANGNKTVTLYGITADMSVEDMFKAGLVLQYEAHRDGLDNGEAGQLKETAEAVLAHSNMAAMILDDELYAGALISLISQDSNLKKDMEAFVALAKSGGDTSGIVEYLTYVDENYDSSADYWRVTKDSSGKITKVQDDGDNSIITVVDEEGNIKSVKINNGKSLTEQIAGLSGSGQTKDDINKVMIKSGLWFEQGKGWYAKTEDGMYKVGQNVPDPKSIIRNLMINKSEDGQISDIRNTTLYQEEIEKELGLPHAACAIASVLIATDNFLFENYGIGARDGNQMIEILKKYGTDAFVTEGSEAATVTNMTALSAFYAQGLGMDDYLIFDSEYTNSNTNKYYVEKAFYKDKNGINYNRTHFLTNTLFGYYDPDRDTHNRWWSINKSHESVYKKATPKSSRISK